MSINLISFTSKITDLNDKTKLDLYELYKIYYHNTNFDTFDNDLIEKNNIIILKDNEKIVGFSTIKTYTEEFDNKPINIVFSGDTIVDKQYWGQNQLSIEFIKFLKNQIQINEHKTYWFLIVKGHRTYKYLNTFAKKFFPHWQYQDENLKNIAKRLASKRYPEYYNPLTNIIEFNKQYAYLNTDIVVLNDEQKNKACVEFFLKSNPNYFNGDELVCLTEVSLDNLTNIAKRIYDKV